MKLPRIKYSGGKNCLRNPINKFFILSSVLSFTVLPALAEDSQEDNKSNILKKYDKDLAQNESPNWVFEIKTINTEKGVIPVYVQQKQKKKKVSILVII